MLTGLASGFYSFAAFRFLLGLAGVYWEAYSQVATALRGKDLRRRPGITHVGQY